MKAIFWYLCEALIVLAMIYALHFGPRAFRALAGLTSPDQQLLWAAGGDSPDAVLDALAEGGSPAACDANHTTPLMLAAIIGHVDSVRALLDHGADVDAVDDYGESALFYAARADRASAVVLLLAHGADPHRRDHFGHIPLDEAEIFHAPDVAGVLRAEMSKACPRYRH
ncbi:MAG TPA: ankyrin repeat domain-containing protein [Tepidisphaeraceae bacterium]|jgi:hypothetical protein